MTRSAAALAVLLGTAAPALAADPAPAVKAAWTTAAEKGTDTSLYVTVENDGAEDAIIRVRCDAANFTELRTVDRGEGFPSARSVKAIPIAARGETVLTADGFNVRLLQLTGKLAPGDRFDCAFSLRSGARQKVAVTVREAEAKPE